MSRVSFEQLLEAGAQYGHLKRKWNPHMAPYIFAEKKGIHILDLHKTVIKVDEAAAALKQIAKSGKKIMFVATKKQANKSRFPQGKNLVKDVADWLVEMEAKQTFKGDQIASSGHTYAKEKVNTKTAFDIANGRRDKGYGGANKASGSAPAPKKKAFGLF